MQWVKYLMLSMTAVFAIWAAWSTYSGNYVGGGSMLFCALLVGCLYFFLMRPYLQLDSLATRLSKEGVPTQATIVKSEQTSTYVNKLPVIRLKVRYTINGKEHVREIKQPVSFLAMPAFQLGKRIAILVDPKNTEQFVVR